MTSETRKTLCKPIVKTNMSNFEVPASALDSHNKDIVLAALRHFQKALRSGEDVSYVDELVDLDNVDADQIDDLCIAINTGPEQSA